ncbi:UDP-N-acetylmuramoyl-tripeptide--D-alanyl-D-alanine ligase [Usitatibacter palustris]|uniref:UDP-N-acetylmuramoyl-tripeptide--D-alanyl-D-alanine ligase n=1 Tax=Usitatibacter palustris TaxID=2732487 RepID=A0A6M4H2R9_9PROT|nr:UDP-N-acetylmuramoyl-tripeptide--D-alanyl-D-alanine ligase [Usitatibacter palustris]QJR13849.1 UDP-N-acetylmuramoyl-tripeptide--D-alanyl-D-alanine ligase [Usitatibacter palustris]
MGIAEAANAVGGTLQGAPVAFTGVSTDSRTVGAGELFIALTGENFDGHDYVQASATRGAAAALVSRPMEVAIPQVIVEDTKLALGRLAAAWRARFTLPLVALTGSNGKTTVKEMLAAILARHGGREGVLATEGNLNNDIGMPLTLLKLRESHYFAVIEMGMNHAGEIDYLTHIAQPTVALVTNAHRAHVGMLGSVEAIAQAKGEIYSGLKTGGTAIVNGDDAFASLWMSLNPDRRVLTFGMKEGVDVRGILGDGQLRIITPTDAFAVSLQVAGEHNARNAIAACAAACALEIAPHAIQAGLNGFAGVPGRLQKRAATTGATLVDDSYNANPESMKAALKVLALAPAPRVFVMGDMGELGDATAQMHAEVGAFAKGVGIDRLLALGEASLHAVEAFGAGAEHFTDFEALAARVESAATPNATILIKGSRFMRMERIADRLAQPGGRNAA